MTPATGVPTEGLGLFLLARAFADGCSAMTGTEAVANGVPAFKPVEWKNARQTMLTVAILLTVMYLGTSFLAVHVGAIPTGDRGNGETVLSQIGRTVFGGPTFPYYVLQFFTMAILVLAAQTSFADFPRLSSILARDGFFPRQFSLRGERLAFNSGHRRPGHRLDRPGGGVQRIDRRPDRPVRDRCLHFVHPVAGGHGQALVRRARIRLAPKRPGQRRRCGRDGRCGGDHRRLEVQPGRVDHPGDRARSWSR